MGDVRIATYSNITIPPSNPLKHYDKIPSKELVNLEKTGVKFERIQEKIQFFPLPYLQQNLVLRVNLILRVAAKV